MTRRILQHLARIDPVLSGVIAAVGPYRPKYTPPDSTFHALARAIAHQQLHRNAAESILRRLETRFGGRFPSAAELHDTSDADVRAAGFSFAKIASLKDLARKSLDGTVPERHVLAQLPDAEIIERLTEVRGIGRWTVEMLLIFGLARPDVLPVDDFGIREGFRRAYGLRKAPAARALARYGERWAPYRSIAAWYLWRAVELARLGQLPKPPLRTRLPAVRRRKKRSRRD